MPHYYFLLFLVLSFATQAQHNQCAIQLPQDKVLCAPETITVKASGNVFNLQWFDENFSKIDTGEVFNRFIQEAQKIYVINKQEIGDELILNGDFEQGNTGFFSDYFESCTNPNMPMGSLCITSTSNQFHPAWSSCTDKTTGNGKMLVSDGAANANQKIWCQQVNVQANTTYAFSTWVTSLLPLNPPIMRFTINGDWIGEAFQSSPTPCNWEEFFQIWESGDTTKAEICILNQNLSVMGNDFALDDISFKAVCAHLDSIEISFAPEINVDLGNTIEICSGELHILSNLSINEQALTYFWNTTEQSESITISEPGEYTLTVSNPHYCAKTAAIKVLDIGFPVSALGEDTTVCFDISEGLSLYGGTAKQVIWEWNDRVVDSTDVLKVHHGGMYAVHLSNGENCTTSDYITIDTLCVEALYFPNAFSPNKDGKNEVFKAYGLDAYDFKLTVFNRWGNVLFETADFNQGWDGTSGGKQAPFDVYVYRCTYAVVQPILGELIQKNHLGHFTLLR